MGFQSRMNEPQPTETSDYKDQSKKLNFFKESDTKCAKINGTFGSQQGD